MKNKKEFIKGIILVVIGFLLGINSTSNPTPIFLRILKSINLDGGILIFAMYVWLIICYIGFKKILQSFGKQLNSEKYKVFLLIIVMFLIGLFGKSYIYVEKAYKALHYDIRAIHVDADNSYIDFKWNGTPKVKGSVILPVQNLSNKDIETHIKIIVPDYIKSEIVEDEIVFKNESGELKSFIIPAKSKESLSLDFSVSTKHKEKYGKAYTDEFKFIFFDDERNIEFES